MKRALNQKRQLAILDSINLLTTLNDYQTSGIRKLFVSQNNKYLIALDGDNYYLLVYDIEDKRQIVKLSELKLEGFTSYNYDVAFFEEDDQTQYAFICNLLHGFWIIEIKNGEAKLIFYKSYDESGPQSSTEILNQ